MEKYNWSDLFVGLNIEFEQLVTQEHMNLFKELSGDINPLHIDNDFALSQGFNSPVVYGMLTSSFYSKLVGVYLPGAYCLLQGINISFSLPVYVGDTLTVFGEVSYLNEAYRQIEVKASIKNLKGNIVSKAKVKVGMLEPKTGDFI